MNEAKDKEKDKPRPGLKPVADMVGIELGSGNRGGTPVVRIRRGAGGAFELAAAAMLPLDSTLPAVGAMASKSGGWVLPKAFQAPSAAFAVTSDDALCRMVTFSKSKTLVTVEAKPFTSRIWDDEREFSNVLDCYAMYNIGLRRPDTAAVTKFTFTTKS